MLDRLKRWYSQWEQFWFRPADPTRLAWIRIGCGLIAVYIMTAYSFHLDEFMGENGWYDLKTRLRIVRDSQFYNVQWNSGVSPSTLQPPRNNFEKEFLRSYVLKFGVPPPGPYPRTPEEADYIFSFHQHFGFDFRVFGLPPPANEKQEHFLDKFAAEFHVPPRPPYPINATEEKQIFASMEKEHVDPHAAMGRGLPDWSIWFHVTDPAEMRWVHAVVLVTSVMFTLGLFTRVTSALTWFFYLNYMHRAPNILFGVDTMLSIMLFYLMIGPSGAVWSLDRLIARKWVRNFQERPEPSVSANVSLRLMQIHLCIIYLVAGLAKLIGKTWWNGTAVWPTLAYYELAPMTNPIYSGVLRMLASSAAVFYTFIFLGTYFTLAFEICYPFLIWRPRFRRLFLGCAFVLHGLIGVIMGLATFSIIMFVMNFAFWKSKNEVEPAAAKA